MFAALSSKLQNEIWAPIRLPVLTVFIFFYVFCFGLLDSPKEWLWPGECLQPVMPLLKFLGLNNYLPLFAPNPPNINTRMQVDVQYEDGARELYRYSPQFTAPSLTQLYERFANLYFVGIRHTRYFAGFGRYIARQTDSSARHPARIQFVLLSANMLPPAEAFGKPIPELTNRELIYTYEVQPEDLRR